MARYSKEGKRQGKKVCLLESGNVDFVEGLFGIKALTNEDNNILLSDLKTGKAYIHNFSNIFLS